MPKDIILQTIESDLERRMAKYTNSLDPTNDEVSLAYLIYKYDELLEENKLLLQTINSMY